MANQKLEPKKYSDFSGGQSTNVNESLSPQNTAELIQNFDLDVEIGSLVGRNGTSIVGAQLVDNLSILGLHGHLNPNTPANNKLFATINASGGATSVIYNVITGSTVTTGLTSNKKMRFLTFLGETLAINGSDGVRAWDESNWITTGGAFDLGDMPSGYRFCEEFLNRVYLGGNASNPSRVAYSSTPVSGAVVWGSDTIDIEPEDSGGDMTGFGKVPGYLLIFKQRSMSRWNFRSAFPEEMINIGAYSQESIIKAGGLCGFFSNSSDDTKGFYLTNGGRPKSISKNRGAQIKKWVDAIGANSKTFTAAADDTITSTAHGLSVGDIIRVSSSTTLPAGLSANTDYYVISTATANTFTVSVNNGGSVVNITDAGTGTHTYYHQPNVSGWGTEDYMAWAVGDLVVDGRAFKNVVLKYFIHLDAWVIRSYPTEFKVFSKFLLNGLAVNVAGDDDGQVMRLDDPAVFNDHPSNTPIQLEYQSHEDDFGSNNMKIIKEKVVIATRDNTGLSVSIQPNKKDPVPLGEGLSGDIVDIPITKTIEGNYFKTTIRGQQTGDRLTLKQIEFPNIDVYKNYN